MPAPDRVRMLLDQHADALLRSCVKANEQVSIGQVVARPDSTLSAWLHSPISGTVETVDDTVIIIKNDRKYRADTSHHSLNNWRDLEAMELITRLAEGGVAGLGGAGYSTAAKLAAQTAEGIHTLIINGMECEPYITCDDRMMREQAASIIVGIQILLHASGAKQCIIAIEDDKPEAIAAMRMAINNTNDSRLQVRALPAAYPNGDEGRLIKLLLDREIPRGGLPSTIGIVVHNIATAYACAQWITNGVPLMKRVVTVTGHGIQHPQNVEVCIGTACNDLIHYCGDYQGEIDALLIGGTMMGKSVRTDDVAITKTTNCLIAATGKDIVDQYPQLPCIRCSECAVVCPAQLLPQQLHMYLRNKNDAAALELGLKDCIECGCCDAVCPSHIMLASQFRSAKLRTQS